MGALSGVLCAVFRTATARQITLRLDSVVCGSIVWVMLHRRGPRRHPFGAVLLCIFLLLFLVTFIGWGGLLLLVLAGVVLALVVRSDRTRHGQR